MRIQFVSEQQAAQANATLSDETIQELTAVANHPVAKHKGLGLAILSTGVPQPGEDKIVVNKFLRHFSPAVAFITDEALIAKVKAELEADAPKIAKYSKKK